MGANLLMTSLRVLTWCCVILLAVLSLLPAQVRTGLPGQPSISLPTLGRPPLLWQATA